MGEDKTERAKRLAAALRANLQRRKQQARQPTGPETLNRKPQDCGTRNEPDSEGPNSEGPDSGGAADRPGRKS